jgi:adenylyltransferase/sulfurtransferase
MAAQTCKVVLNEIDVLIGKLLLFDYIKFSFNTIKFSKIEQNFNIKPLDSYEFMCTTNTKINSIELKKHLDNPEYEVIDVRDEIEFIQHNIGGKNIPLNNLINKIQEISFKPNVILICNTGKRSLLAQKKIQDLYKINTFIIALNEF